MTFLSSFLFSLTLIIVIVLLLSLITLLTFSPGLYSLHLLAVRLQHAISGPSSSSSCKSISSAALVTASSPTTGEVEIPYLDSTSGYSTTSHRLKPVSKPISMARTHHLPRNKRLNYSIPTLPPNHHNLESRRYPDPVLGPHP
jgi:hypothetical protein